METVVCSECDLSWSDHLQRARRRAASDWYDRNEDEPLPDDLAVVVSKDDCIALLKEANRGPMGHPGPQGPMGVSGKGSA